MLAEATQALRTSAGAASRPGDKGRPVVIRKAAVLGAGTMGSRIAAHLANAGVAVVLLDIVPAGAAAGNKAARNAVAASALDALKKAKPAAFYDAASARLIAIGNFEDDLVMLSDCDWIIEAVAENLDIKRSLLRRVDAVRRPDTLITTNTSGLPLAQIAEGMPDSFKQHWFGTHFFNPPRYMKLLEIIPGAETNAAAITAVAKFADQRLGKTIVVAKDTPNFIANRIGTFALLNAANVMQTMDMSIEQVDALTGPVLGWPKTGTFRLADMVGIDVLGHVARNFHLQVRDERADVTFPDFISRMLERKWLGDKAGQGFFKKERGPDGSEIRFGIDWRSLEYRPSARAKFPTLEMTKNVESVAERIAMVLANDPAKDPAAAFYWRILPDLWNYAAYRVPDVSDTVVGVDRAMKAGFNWELGPFEMWDAAGVPSTVERMKTAGLRIAPAAEKLLSSGNTTWYKDDSAVPSGRVFFDVVSGAYQPVVNPEGVSTIQIVKKANGVVAKNAGASLVDLGEGVACIELHSKMNAIGADIVTFITQNLKSDSPAVAQFDSFVISSDASDFSVGANLMQLLLAIQEHDWYDIDLMITAFQTMTQSIRFCPRPVVAAPFAMCFGGGAEICIHGTARQLGAELYMGLVETGVGLLPAGGGCKEMVMRAIESAPSVRDGARIESIDFVDAMRRTFETIAMAKVSTSAVEAKQLGLARASDAVTTNRARLLTDAKARARELAAAGYTPPARRTDLPAPGENVLAMLRMGVHIMREGEFISDHDVRVANAVAHVLCGGRITGGTPVSEQYFLDLEREGFLSLCGELKTQERIAYTLKNGKPLRN